MKTEEIIENNKLIAEFMNLDVGFADTNCPMVVGEKNMWTAILYHKSWDWLMPVVEKIESITKTTNQHLFKKLLHYSRNQYTIFDLKLTESLIDKTYKYCIAFIKWYNENK
jgi:hypothetical protein